MRAVILAAGYAMRMHPLTATRTKSLLPIAGGRVVLDWTMEALQQLPEVSDIALVSNAKFAGEFAAWLAERRWPKAVTLIDDGSTEDANRRGAIRDLLLAVERLGADAPLLVTAGDHIAAWDWGSFAAFGRAHAPAASVALYQLPDPREATRCGIAEVDARQRLVHCEEKPAHPRSSLAVICVYYLPPAVLPRLREYLATGLNADAPGHFIAWLSRQEPVYGWPSQGAFVDIGTCESYQATCTAFASRVATVHRPSGGQA